MIPAAKKPVVAAVKHDPATTAEFDPLNSSGRAPNKQEVKPSQSAASSLSSGVIIILIN